MGSEENRLRHSLDIPLNPKPPPEFKAIADTGCTGHFVVATHSYEQIHKADNRITVTLPSGSKMTSQQYTHLPFPGLPKEAGKAKTAATIEKFDENRPPKETPKMNRLLLV